MNNPFEYVPDEACAEAFRQLLARIDELKRSDRPVDQALCRELESGKMLGVLVAEGETGRSVLYAFSGQIGEFGFNHPDFVGSPLDYLHPDGYFRRKEMEISRMNAEIAEYERGELSNALTMLSIAREKEESAIGACREQFRRSKMEREERRKRGEVTPEEREAMIRASQFEKAELRRLKKRMAARLAPLEAAVEEGRLRMEEMKERRRQESEALQEWLFGEFRLLNARGESKSLREIFAATRACLPPAGAGECCAPKLLQAAYIMGLRPLSMAEYWYGKPKDGEVRVHGEHYPACRGKCLPVLRWMLEGLDVQPPLSHALPEDKSYELKIIYENDRFCVVDKPSGMLSVAGKGSAVSAEEWLRKHYGPGREVKVAHRLDRDTSGLLLAAFGPEAFTTLQRLFAGREVRKTYEALLEGDYRQKGIPAKGSVRLPLSPDWLDRPRQRVDTERGMDAVTEYEFLSSDGVRSHVIFHPLTGRTHQLRVHAASESGLGMPIVGDPLYGRNGGKGAARLFLHARKIEFRFPLDGRDYSFESGESPIQDYN